MQKNSPIKWSILIRTVPDRYEQLTNLLSVLYAQMQKGVEIIVLCDDKETPVGDKCHRLVEASSAKYISFIDDDDMVSMTYIPKIMEQLDHDYDAVGFNVEFWEDGKLMKPMILNPKYRWWEERETQYEVGVSTWMAVKREIALKGDLAGRKGEDRRYMYAVTPHIKTSHHIDKVLYMYVFNSDKTLVQGGQDI